MFKHYLRINFRSDYEENKEENMEEVEEKTLRLENDCVPSGLKFLKISRYIWIRSGLSEAVKIDIKILYIICIIYIYI